MKLNEIEAQLIQIVERLRGLGVPAPDLDDVTELTDAGEPGVAFENLCTQLYEYDVLVPQDTIAALRRIGALMNIEPRFWESLATGSFLVAGLTLDRMPPQAGAIGRLEGDLERGDLIFEVGTGRPVGKVTGINAYGHSIPSLSSGMTAQLEIELADGALPLPIPSTWLVRRA